MTKETNLCSCHDPSISDDYNAVAAADGVKTVFGVEVAVAANGGWRPQITGVK